MEKATYALSLLYQFDAIRSNDDYVSAPKESNIVGDLHVYLLPFQHKASNIRSTSAIHVSGEHSVEKQAQGDTQLCDVLEGSRQLSSGFQEHCGSCNGKSATDEIGTADTGNSASGDEMRELVAGP